MVKGKGKGESGTAGPAEKGVAIQPILNALQEILCDSLQPALALYNTCDLLDTTCVPRQHHDIKFHDDESTRVAHFPIGRAEYQPPT